jgi:hypothetical protein
LARGPYEEADKKVANVLAFAGKPYEEADKKVANVLAFAGKHKHPLQCVLERADQIVRKSHG